MNISVFSKLDSRDVNTSPYAHLVRDGALDQAIYERLARDFPPPERFVGDMQPGNNQAIRIPAKDIVGNSEFSPEWQEFFRFHTSQDFWKDIVRVMGDAIRKAHPALEARMGKPLEQWTVKRRGTDQTGDIIMDALFVVNTPVRTMGSVRPAHVDNEDEIWAGLLYMRPDDDPTTGGDLAIYHFKSRPAFGGHYAPLSAVHEDKVVSYQANRLVSFVNSELSIHGVTPRPITDRYRRYINMVALLPFKGFTLPKMSPLGQVKFWMERRKTKSHGVMAKSR
jgi:hypothetical protein